MVANTNGWFTGLPAPDHGKSKIKRKAKIFKEIQDPNNPKITAHNYNQLKS